ncbi:MAG: carbamoyltransferase [Elusimicrobia bacterium]|nr:carbamoyltransferase [Elusimicrobiota bacterium]
MHILGISCHYHDAAAALVSDGRVVAAAEEERFTRLKHDASFPRQAVAYVLREGGVQAGDLRHVVYYEKPLLKFDRILSMTAERYPGAIDQFVPAMQTWLATKLWIPSLIRSELAYRGSVLYAEHHMSHAASAFYASPFEEAAVLTMDAIGEWATTTIGHGKGLDLGILKEIQFPHSLGLLYSILTSFLGFRPNDGEYKVMGLAAYGKPRYAEKVRRIIRSLEDGSFRLDLRYLSYQHERRPWTRAFEELFGRPCVAPDEIADLDERAADIAASIQLVTEETILALAREAHRATGSRDLCLAGGVALNVLANARLLAEGPFERIYVPPGPGDSGGAIGAAAYVAHAVERLPRVAELRTAQLGPSFDEHEIGAFLQQMALPHERLGDEMPAVVADLIASGSVVGWFQGRMEFGPRALGSRSILANACDPAMKELVNRKIKHREPFRPFAPSVPLEDAHRYFEGSTESPFMSFVARVRPEARRTIPAVTHLDGTARLQTVTASDHPTYHGLLRALEHRIGVPIVLNTSFNVAGEPIVRSPEEAFGCFSSTDMDALVLGRFLLRRDAKREPRLEARASTPDVGGVLVT